MHGDNIAIRRIRNNSATWRFPGGSLDTLVCTEFEAFEDALQGVDGRYLLSARPREPWRLRITEFDGLCVMAGRDGGANIYQASLAAGCYALLLSRSRVPLALNGEWLAPGTAAWLVPGAEFHMRVRAAAPWLAIMVPSRLLDAAAAGWDEAPDLRTSRVVRPAPAALAALLWRLRELARSPVAPPAPALTALLLARCVQAVIQSARATMPARAPGRPLLDRQRMISRALSLIAAQPDRSLRVDELAAAAGVSSRTLYAAFTTQFGQGPHQYLMNWRLHAVHADLGSAAPTDTVSILCARYGIWDFGRFARAYQQLFGLLPSEHLSRRQAGPQPGR